ncbi:unnamed protein product [Ectocarpus sp. CCAP 1310/34]|nr:unnamed protein product [Ectocarpus sp. CCAP 1310/34]
MALLDDGAARLPLEACRDSASDSDTEDPDAQVGAFDGPRYRPWATTAAVRAPPDSRPRADRNTSAPCDLVKRECAPQAGVPDEDARDPWRSRRTPNGPLPPAARGPRVDRGHFTSDRWFPADAPAPEVDQNTIQEIIKAHGVSFNHARGLPCKRMVQDHYCRYLHTDDPLSLRGLPAPTVFQTPHRRGGLRREPPVRGRGLRWVGYSGRRGNGGGTGGPFLRGFCAVKWRAEEPREQGTASKIKLVNRATGPKTAVQDVQVATASAPICDDLERTLLLREPPPMPLTLAPPPTTAYTPPATVNEPGIRVSNANTGHNFFTLLDLPSGYHQLSIKEADCHKTAFRNVRGRLYGFMRCGFDLTTILAVFSAQLGDTRRPVEVRPSSARGAPPAPQLKKWVGAAGGPGRSERPRRSGGGRKVSSGKDMSTGASGAPTRAASNVGWATFFCTVEEHLFLIEEVLDLLHEAGYSVHFKKCTFYLSEVEFLGAVVGRSGVRPAPSKIKAVQEMVMPATDGEVRSFLGLAGYLRAVLPDFRALPELITDLLRDKTFSSKRARYRRVPWGPAQTEAFQAIIKAVENCEAPLGYTSHRFTRTEEGLSPNDHEVLGVLYGIEQFCTYMQHRRFTLVTDCAALTRLFTSQNLSSKMCRWALRLMGIDIELR